jgi:hypothetical protein
LQAGRADRLDRDRDSVLEQISQQISLSGTMKFSRQTMLSKATWRFINSRERSDELPVPSGVRRFPHG